MNLISKQVVFSEVPNEVSLSFFISWCNINCKGCHSKDSWDSNKWEELSKKILSDYIDEYEGLITTVLFLWGEWEHENLVILMKEVKKRNLKTALYTWLALGRVNIELLSLLDYIKVGPYIEQYGPLNKKTTNQRFFDLKNNKDLTYTFFKD